MNRVSTTKISVTATDTSYDTTCEIDVEFMYLQHKDVK